ncbi:MAG TPA: hypothetical protein PKA06_11025 [Gemmatales bacterium]|nr:hypothetical protein [Gemmatales bacterium]
MRFAHAAKTATAWPYYGTFLPASLLATYTWPPVTGGRGAADLESVPADASRPLFKPNAA